MVRRGAFITLEISSWKILLCVNPLRIVLIYLTTLMILCLSYDTLPREHMVVLFLLGDKRTMLFFFFWKRLRFFLAVPYLFAELRCLLQLSIGKHAW